MPNEDKLKEQIRELQEENKRLKKRVRELEDERLLRGWYEKQY